MEAWLCLQGQERRLVHHTRHAHKHVTVCELDGGIARECRTAVLSKAHIRWVPVWQIV